MLTNAFQTASDVASGLTSGPSFNIWNLVQFGFIGLGFACLAVRKFIVPEWVLKQAEDRHAQDLAAERAKSDVLQKQVDKMQDVFQDKMIPALTRASEIISVYNEETARRRWASQPSGARPDAPAGEIP